MQKINLVNLNKTNLKTSLGIQKGKMSPVIKTAQANSLDLMSNYNKATALSFKGSILTPEEKARELKQLKFRDDQGESYPLFKEPYEDIEKYLIWDEKKYQRTLEFAGLIYTNENGVKESIFQDGTDIRKIVQDEANYERALKLINMKYIDSEGNKKRVFTEGYGIRRLSLNEINFKKAQTLASLKFKNSKGQEEMVFKNGSVITSLVNDLKFCASYNFDERAKALASITYTNLSGKEERVFQGRDIAKIAQSMYPQIDANFKKWVSALASIKHKNLNNGYDQALFSKDITEIALDKNIGPLAFEQVERLRKQVLDNPDSYINGQFENDEIKRYEVDCFFDENFHGLALSCSILGDKLTNELLKTRFDDAKDYLDTLLSFASDDSTSGSYNIFDDLSYNYSGIDLLKGLLASKDDQGKPFSSKQQIEFIDLVGAYKNNEMDMSDMYSMIEGGRIDMDKLNSDLFRSLLRNIGFDSNEISKIPDDKLKGWNMKYIHLLSKELNGRQDEETFKEFFKASNLYDFKKYIENPLNKFGQANKHTKMIFEQEGLDYDKWFNPSNSNNIHFRAKDKNTQCIFQMAQQSEEDIEELRKGPVKNFIDKRFAPYIKDDKFVIPHEYKTSKTRLLEFNKNIMNQLDGVFERAQTNKYNPQKREISESTLTIKSHFLQRISELEKMPDFKTVKDLDLTIKMWDRIPQKDIFQGNYSTCCIGMGEGNGTAMPHYLMNSAFNMIELVDNQTQNTIGNALCYFVKTPDNNPALIVDNIEIKNSKKPSKEVGIKLRDTITDFARNVSYDVTGQNDVKIYMGTRYNDIPIDDLEISEKHVQFLGDVDCDNIYLDLFGSNWRNRENLNGRVSLYELD